jgi:hypothetical protein
MPAKLSGKKPPANRGPGRPATGRDPTLGGRVPAELIAAVDDYAAKAGINRSDAMRRLLEAGLKRRPKPAKSQNS